MYSELDRGLALFEHLSWKNFGVAGIDTLKADLQRLFTCKMLRFCSLM